MENDYISREAAIYVHKLQCAGCANQQDQDYSEYCKVCTIYNEIKCTEALPAADVRPVVRGQYIGDYDGYADGAPVYDIWSCSVCGCVFEDWDEKPTYNFCPNCGADMREVDSDG